MVIASLVAPALRTLDQAYQFIQEDVSFISPGVLAIFLLGFFWKRTTSAAALAAACAEGGRKLVLVDRSMTIN